LEVLSDYEIPVIRLRRMGLSAYAINTQACFK
jgi:hypothetical protein